MCDRFPWNFYVQTSYELSNYVLGLISVVNIKFPWASYHTIVPSIEELYCLNSGLCTLHSIQHQRYNRQLFWMHSVSVVRSFPAVFGFSKVTWMLFSGGRKFPDLATTVNFCRYFKGFLPSELNGLHMYAYLLVLAADSLVVASRKQVI